MNYREFLKKYRKALLLSVLAGLVFAIGFFLGQMQKPHFLPNTILRQSGYHYINPVLICNVGEGSPALEDKKLRDVLNNYLESAPEKDISVYGLFIKNNQWVSINENELFSPASMLKVPTMTAILKKAENHPEILGQAIYYDGSFDDNKAEYFKSKKSIKAGDYYTVGELLSYMVGYSDNNATRLLHSVVSPQDIADIYKILNINIPDTTSSDFITAKGYLFFIRLLYNSTYLSRDMSEKALSLMSASDFPEGIRAGVPDSVEVAQKFGERQILSPDTQEIVSRELHDCGIIYAPNNPYLLCIMTKGKDFSSLSKEMGDISKIVYQSVTGR